MAMVNGGELVVRTLARAGVKQAFGLHGAHLETLFQSCAAHGIAILDTRHEAAAGHAAEGYARASRGLGVALVTAGPGFTNCITSIANAHLDRTPVLYVSGAAALRDAETNTLQAGIDQVAIARPITKWAHQITVAEQIPRLVAHAIRIATSVPTGPVLLDMPMDVLTAGLEESTVSLPEHVQLEMRAAPQPNAVEAALALLAQAARPIVLAGVGAWQSDCGAELKEFVEATGIPVFSDFQAHGLIPSDHPLYGGTTHKLADLSAPGQRPDVVLALGTRFGLFTLGASDKLVPRAAKIIHVESDAREIGKVREVTLPIVADPRATLRALTARLSTQRWPQREAWHESIAAMRKARAERNRAAADAAAAKSDGTRMHPYHAVAAIADNLPAGATVIGDGAEAYHWMNETIRQNEPGSYITHGFLGAVGFGLGLAIGAQRARPERPVLCLAGDGAIGFTIAEFDTLARHNLPIVVVVLNNRSWGASQHFQEMIGNPVRGTRLAAARYEEVAKAFGCAGIRVTTAAELGAAIREAFASRRPTCINAEIDVGPWPPELELLASRHS